MNTNKYKGIIPALYACYDENGKLSTERTQAFTRYLIGKGVQGVYVGGSSGECIYHTVAERKAQLEAVMAVAKGKIIVIAHIACNNTADGCELAAHAESLGVDAIASIPPIYFKLPEHAIAAYWNAMSAAAPNTDFIIYNIPQLAGVSLTLPLLREMKKNPRVIGVKNSSMPTQDIQMFVAEGGDNFVVFNGPDEQYIAGRAIGASAGIGGTYSAMPELYLQMEKHFAAGELTRARELQYAANDIITALCSCHGNMYAVIKETLRLRNQIDIGGVRSPLASLIPEDDAKVAHCVELIEAAITKYC